MRALASLASAAFLVAIASCPASSAGLTEVWRATGFDEPESVAFDTNTNSYYVSNISGDPSAKDGNGFVSKLDADGKVVSLKWATGLNGPKGTGIAGDHLFVADIDELVEIDLADGKVLNRYPAPGAKYLNDIVVAGDGRIYISDTFGNAIYLFQDGKVSEWLRDDDALVGPNGLAIMNTDLVVARLGDASQGFDKLKPGNVVAIDLISKKIRDFGTRDPIGGLDGIAPTEEGAVDVTDNPGGRLLKVEPGQPAVEIAPVPPGTADFLLRNNLGLLILPEMGQNAVVAYHVG